MRLHRLDSPDSLSRLLSTQYTNVFLFVCPDEYFDDDGNAVDDDFRGCNDFMERVFRVSGALGDNSVVSFRLGLAAASTTSDVARSFRLPPSPVVLYARKNQAGETHVAQFVGDMSDADMDETFITMWARDNSLAFTRTLGQDDFEHLTQAASGATTGDWLVVFADADAWQRNAALRLAVDTIASEYKHQLSVAFVDAEANPKLAKRLKVSSASSSSSPPPRDVTLRYFRLEKMYYYDHDATDFQTLRAFVTGGYRKFRAEKVPAEPTPFDQLVESIVTRLKELGYPSFVGTLLLILAFAAAMSVLIILACCASKEGKDQDTKFKKG